MADPVKGIEELPSGCLLIGGVIDIFLDAGQELGIFEDGLMLDEPDLLPIAFKGFLGPAGWRLN